MSDQALALLRAYAAIFAPPAGLQCDPAVGCSPGVCPLCCASYMANATACSRCVAELCGDHGGGNEGDDNSLHNSAWLLGIVLLPFIGRFLVDYLGPAVEHSVAGRDGLCKRQRKKEIRDYRTCLDRPFVQKEIGWAKEYGKEVTIMVEGDRRKQGYWKDELAVEKYSVPQPTAEGTVDLSWLLRLPQIQYRRDRAETRAMVDKLLAREVGGDLARTQTKQDRAASPLNQPGHWDFFLSHGQASAGDQVKTLCLLLKERGFTVWYDNDMADRSTAAMEEGVRHSACFILFLSGDPPIHGQQEQVRQAHRGWSCLELPSVQRQILLARDSPGRIPPYIPSNPKKFCEVFLWVCVPLWDSQPDGFAVQRPSSPCSRRTRTRWCTSTTARRGRSTAGAR